MSISTNGIDLKTLISQEAGVSFKGSKCCCPFHGEKTPSFSVNSNGQFYKCFGCGESGDAITFMQKYHNITFVEAVKQLGLDDQLSNEYKPKIENKIKVENKLKEVYEEKGNFSLKNVYEFSDVNGKVLYYKAKLKDSENVSQARYATIVEGNVELSLKDAIQVPYRLEAIQKSLMYGRPIYITEGEKDAETLSNLFHVCATSLKGVKLSEYNFFQWKNAEVYFVGDTGIAGEKYRDDVFEVLKEYVKHFYVVEIDGLEALGDNKDVTDWLESIGDMEEAKRLFNVYCNPCNAWDFMKSRLWKNVSYNEKKGCYTPCSMSVDNVLAFLKRKGIVITTDQVTNIRKIISPEPRFLDGNGHLSLSDIVSAMWNEGCKIKPEVVAAVVEKLKAATTNYFQKMISDSRNKNHGIIDKFIDLLRLETDLEKSLVRKFLFNYVNQGFNTIGDGYVAQGALVMQGAQGIGKSTFVEAMALNDPMLFYRSSQGLDLDDRHSIRTHTSRNLVELAEMIVTTRKDASAMKSFLSQSIDVYRPLYCNDDITKARYSVYISTTNNTSFLQDSTGSRRYWVIHPNVNPETGYIDLPEQAGIDMKEVLGAVYDILIDSSRNERMALCSLKKEAIIEINNVNVGHHASGNIGEIFKEIFDITSEKRNVYTRKDLYKLLEKYKITMKDDATKVKNFLEANGVKICDKYGNAPLHRVGGKVVRGYKLWDLNCDDCIEEDEKKENKVSQVIKQAPEVNECCRDIAIDKEPKGFLIDKKDGRYYVDNKTNKHHKIIGDLVITTYLGSTQYTYEIEDNLLLFVDKDGKPLQFYKKFDNSSIDKYNEAS